MSRLQPNVMQSSMLESPRMTSRHFMTGVPERIFGPNGYDVSLNRHPALWNSHSSCRSIQKYPSVDACVRNPSTLTAECSDDMQRIQPMLITGSATVSRHEMRTQNCYDMMSTKPKQDSDFGSGDVNEVVHTRIDPSNALGEVGSVASPSSSHLTKNTKSKKKRPKKPPLKVTITADRPTMVSPLIDSAEKQHQCPDCPRKFSWHFQLQQHSRTHSGERPFVCSDCQQAYKRREHLQRHERIHTGERPFECKHCEKKYRRKSQLVRHARIHTGERPYLCTVCKKTFRRRGHLCRHYKTHGADVLQEFGVSLDNLTKTFTSGPQDCLDISSTNPLSNQSLS